MNKPINNKLNRRQAIALHCLECSGFKYKDRRDCSFNDCFLRPYRTGEGKQDAKSRSKDIRAFCKVQCMCGSSYEVTLCPSVKCPLYPFRKSEIDKSYLT